MLCRCFVKHLLDIYKMCLCLLGYDMHWVDCPLLSLICETQWRHSVKRRLYNTPPPYFILWNAVTSLGENKGIQEPSPILYSVKRSDVTWWKQGYIRTLPHTSLYIYTVIWWLLSNIVHFKVLFFLWHLFITYILLIKSLYVHIYYRPV